MTPRMTCGEAREWIAGYREGWLGPIERTAMEAHLDSCAECARDLRRDEALSRALAAVPDEAAPARAAVHWAPPAATRAWYHGPLPRLAAAMAFAVVVLVALSRPVGRHPSVVNPIGPPATLQPAPLPAETARWTDAHATLALSDASADPNRSLVLLYASHGAEARQ